MNKAFKKILERLEEKTIPVLDEDEHIIPESNIREPYEIEMVALSDVKQIVQEVAEEFATDTNVGTNGWIACSEKLPEEEADVLLSLRSLDVYTGFRANAEGCFYIDGDGYVEYENVIAWMPLPEPYKESDE